MNICMVGHGMMGRWHSQALSGRTDCCLHTLVGRNPESTAAFAAEFGYRKWTTNLTEALEDSEISGVVVAGPSETHAEMALASLAHGKHTLVEIPLAMSARDAKEVVNLASRRNLILGVVHPTRFHDEMNDLRERVQNGEEFVRQMIGQFYTHRLENVGLTGYRRTWTDNILWHHTLHLLDFGLWPVDQPVRKVQSFMPPPDPTTGTPMDVFYGLETEADQSLVFTGSYYAHQPVHRALIVTDRETYSLDIFHRELTTKTGTRAIAAEQLCNAKAVKDFIGAVRDNRNTKATGTSVLPAMRVLQEVQDIWDSAHGEPSIPGRALRS